VDMVTRTLLIAACFGAISGCSHATGPGNGFLQGDALVSQGAETCAVTLLVAGRRYEPVGLPDSLAVVGLRLRVAGVVRDVPTLCMVGPRLELTSVARE